MVSKVRFRGEQGRVAITHDMEHEILDPIFYIQNNSWMQNLHWTKGMLKI